jgi:hypothetical protein
MYDRVWSKFKFTSDNDTKTANTDCTNHNRRWRCMWNRKSNVDSECLCDRYLEMEYRSNNVNHNSRSRNLYSLL